MSESGHANTERPASRSSARNACMRCGTPVSVVWHLPSSCKECDASFDARPRRIGTVAFLVATICAIAVMAILRQFIDITGVLVIAGLLIGFVGFNLAEVLMFRFGVLRLTNVNTPDDSPSISLSPSDPRALSEAEKAARTKDYAGSSKQTRVAQGAQLRESLQLARSNITSEKPAPQKSEKHKRRAGSRQNSITLKSDRGPRCSFARVDATNDAAIRRASELAINITREHFDPLVGVEQNDYMIDHFLSPFAIREQMEGGYEYYIVLSPAQPEKRSIGIVAARPQSNHVLHISRFHLLKEERGKGYSHSMMRLVRQRAAKSGCSRITTHVMKDDFQAILVCEHLGFSRTGERHDEIGSGFVMDILIYELELQ